MQSAPRPALTPALKEERRRSGNEPGATAQINPKHALTHCCCSIDKPRSRFWLQPLVYASATKGRISRQERQEDLRSRTEPRRTHRD